MDRLEILKERSSLLRTVREFFHRLEFVEVQTPTLSADTMVDPAIDPIALSVEGSDKTFYLQTSPEFALKRLLLEGMTRIYEITPAFRNSEIGNRHNPEFTMLEWYRVDDSYEQGIELLIQFGMELFPESRIENLTYLEAFQSKFDINPHLAKLEQLKDLASRFNIQTPEGSLDRDTVLQILMSEMVEPDLGQDSLCVIRDWPESQSALAQVRTTEEGCRVAERFELYFNGIELANGYHELNDAEEQLRRMQANNRSRKKVGLAELPVQSKLLDSMTRGRLPDCCGVAVGIDRLLMVKMGLSSITQVLSYDFEKA